MKPTIRPIVLLLISFILMNGHVLAQRISFGLYAGEGILLEPMGLAELNFNTKQPLIFASQSVSILKQDQASAIIRITGRLDQEITASISASPTLDLNTSHIPLSIRFAYYNAGAASPSDNEIKATAIELPLGFSSFTFPFKKNLTGIPAPPPTPINSNYTSPQGTAYLVIYGNLGPVPSDAAAGYYNGDINIRVEYATN